MSAELVGVYGLIGLILLLVSRMWIGLTMAIVGFLGIFLLRVGRSLWRPGDGAL